MPKYAALVFSVWLTLLLVCCGGGDLPKNVRDDAIKHIEIENTVNSTSLQTTVSLVQIIKSAKATPPKEFIDKYNPKRTYCVSCRFEKETFERGKSPEKYTEYDDFLALVTQSGETQIVTHLPMSNSMLSANKASPGVPKVSWEERQTWENLWAKSCPHQPEHKKR